MSNESKAINHNPDQPSAASGCSVTGKSYETVEELIAETCSPEVMREFLKLTAPPKNAFDTVRRRLQNLEMAMLQAGRKEMEGAIDDVEMALVHLRTVIIRIYK